MFLPGVAGMPENANKTTLITDAGFAAAVLGLVGAAPNSWLDDNSYYMHDFGEETVRLLDS